MSHGNLLSVKFAESRREDLVDTDCQNRAPTLFPLRIVTWQAVPIADGQPELARDGRKAANAGIKWAWRSGRLDPATAVDHSPSKKPHDL